MKTLFLLIALILFSVIPVSQNIKHSKIDSSPSSPPQSTKITAGIVQESESQISTKPSSSKQIKSEPKKDKGTTSSKNQQKQSSAYSLSVSSSSDQFWAPISVNGTEYKIGFTLEEDIPSWVFTSLTDNHQLCDQENNCDQAESVIKCKKNQLCKQQSQSLQFKSEKVKGTKSVALTFKNEDEEISEIFVSPEKVKIGEGYDSIEEIAGMLNLNKKAFILKNDQIVVNSTLPEKQTIHLDDLKDKNIEVKGQESDEKASSIKFSSIRLTFEQNEILSVPSQFYSQILRVLKKDHLEEGKCKMYSSSFKCKKPVDIDREATINICLKNKCFKVRVSKLLQEDSSSSKKINILFKKSQNDDIVFSPAITQFLELYVANGQVQGLKFQDSSPKPTEEEQSDSEQQSDSDEEQNEQKSVIKDKGSEKDEEDDQDQKDEEEEEDSDEEEGSKEKKKKEKSHKKKHLTQSKEETKTEEKSKNYSRGLLSTFLIYGGIAFMIIIVVKMKAQQSFVAAVIDNCLNKTWYRVMDKYFKNSKGYNPTQYNEHEEQQIDHDDTVAVGYTENQGRQLFWERNSVEGI